MNRVMCDNCWNTKQCEACAKSPMNAILMVAAARAYIETIDGPLTDENIATADRIAARVLRENRIHR